MNQITAPNLSAKVRPWASLPELSLFRLYTLRVCYLVLAAGIGTYYWPSVIQHSAGFAQTSGIQTALLAGLGLTAVLGLRYPVKMLPLLLFELAWKAIYLMAFALPLWRANQISEAMAEDVKAVLMVVIFIPLIPWGHVWRAFVMARGERWR